LELFHGGSPSWLPDAFATAHITIEAHALGGAESPEPNTLDDLLREGPRPVILDLSTTTALPLIGPLTARGCPLLLRPPLTSRRADVVAFRALDAVAAGSLVVAHSFVFSAGLARLASLLTELRGEAPITLDLALVSPVDLRLESGADSVQGHDLVAAMVSDLAALLLRFGVAPADLSVVSPLSNDYTNGVRLSSSTPRATVSAEVRPRSGASLGACSALDQCTLETPVATSAPTVQPVENTTDRLPGRLPGGGPPDPRTEPDSAMRYGLLDTTRSSDPNVYRQLTRWSRMIRQ
jgi:hypothetical protein